MLSGSALAMTSDISILAVLADRDFILFRPFLWRHISILAVLADRDVFEWWERLVTVIFQSSRSLRTATLSI